MGRVEYGLFEFQKDKNEDDPNAEIEMIDAIGYGRLDFILAITLSRSQEFHIDIPTTHILAHITEAKDVEGDGATEILRFSHFGRSVVLDITSIKHVAGRVFTQGMRQTGEWAIVDRSEGVARTDFQVDEHGSDDEEVDQAYFFSGEHYVRVRWTEGVVNDELLEGPTPIKYLWPQTGFDQIDTIIPWPGQHDGAYIFSGDYYVRVRSIDSSGDHTPPHQNAVVSRSWSSLHKAGFYW
ncbi:hypothetical protein CTheo_7856 [Ceratobasidium theobromae]|uniref:Uncharacterized protein n=1 Tax=Ceratobasidium theobromae TaxID=1582974 RepID=A0A5N5QBB6_9AGAM|nr:hypothetical protein CTheo_7856 [Ceratobasidium theobromae]